MTSPGAPIDGHRVERMTRVMIARAALPLDLERVYAQGSAWCVVVRDRTGRVVELVIPRRATAAAFRVDLKRFLEAAAPPRAVADTELSARFTAALQPHRDDATRAIGVALDQTVGSADTDVAARIVAARLGDATIAAVHLLQARLPPSGDTRELARRRSRIRERASGLAADIIVTCVEQGVLRRDQMAIGLQTVVAREVFHYLSPCWPSGTPKAESERSRWRSAATSADALEHANGTSLHVAEIASIPCKELVCNDNLTSTC